MSAVLNIFGRPGFLKQPTRKLIGIDADADAVEMRDPLTQTVSNPAPAESTPEPRTRQEIVADIINALKEWNLAGFEEAMKEYTKSLGNEASADDLIPALIKDFGRQDFGNIVTLLARIANIADVTVKDQRSLGYNVTTVSGVLVYVYVDKVLSGAVVKRFDDSGNSTPVFDAYVTALTAYLFGLGKSEFSVDDRVPVVAKSVVASVKGYAQALNRMKKAMQENAKNARYAYALYLTGLSHGDVAESMRSNPDHFMQIAGFINDLSESEDPHYVKMRKTLIRYAKDGDEGKCTKDLYEVAGNAGEYADSAVNAHKDRAAKMSLFMRFIRFISGAERREQAELARMQRMKRMADRAVDAIVGELLFPFESATSTQGTVMGQLQEGETPVAISESSAVPEGGEEDMQEDQLAALVAVVHAASREASYPEWGALFSDDGSSRDFGRNYEVLLIARTLELLHGYRLPTVEKFTDMYNKDTGMARLGERERLQTLAYYAYALNLSGDDKEALLGRASGMSVMQVQRVRGLVSNSGTFFVTFRTPEDALIRGMVRLPEKCKDPAKFYTGSDPTAREQLERQCVPTKLAKLAAVVGQPKESWLL